MIRVFNQYVSLKGVLLAVLELFSVALALWLGVTLRFWNMPSEFAAYVRFPIFPVQFLIVAGTLQICFYYNDLYDFSALRRGHEEWICLGQSIGASCVVLGILYYLAPRLMLGRGVFFISMALGSLLIVLSRLILDTTWQATAPKQRVLILGAGNLAGAIAREFSARSDLSTQLLGFVQPGNAPLGDSPLPGYKMLGPLANLESITQAAQATRIVVALEERRQMLPIRDLFRLRAQGIIVEDAHTTISALTGRVWLDTVCPSWFVFSEGFRRSALLLGARRIVDLLCATVGLLLLSPIMVLAALAIRLDSKGPVIYKQRRVGMGGRYFSVLKFRSMHVDAERASGAQWATVDDPRVTRVGRYLRKFRVDEFPQFINVLRGDMSFVGPRPERPEFVEQLRDLIPYYDERHTVRPGITGWAQVQYPYGASVEDAYRKLEYDLFYLKNMSVMFDVAIIFHTVRTIISGRGGR